MTTGARKAAFSLYVQGSEGLERMFPSSQWSRLLGEREESGLRSHSHGGPSVQELPFST